MDEPASPEQEEIPPYQVADTPDCELHECPYAAHGADKEFCLSLTTNYNRNLNGCCGSNDSRGFGPCSSKWRKCFKCVGEGKGKNADEVVDVDRGLCQSHLDVSSDQKPNLYVRPLSVARLTPSRVAPKRVDKPKVRIVKVREFVPAAKKPPEPSPKPDPKPEPILKLETESKSEPIADPKPVAPLSAMSEFDLNQCVQKYRELTELNKKSLGFLLRGEPVPSWGPKSTKTKKSELCTMVGIPKGKPGGQDRLELVRRVVARVEEIESGQTPSPAKADG